MYLFPLILMNCFILKVCAQITVFNDIDVDPGIPCDEGRFRISFSMNFITDTTRVDSKFQNELMILEIGKKTSLFYSYTNYVADSVYMADRRNGVSQSVINEHLQQFGSGKISWEIYKNYKGSGNTILLDKLGMARYKCEESAQVPIWNLIPDTLTVIGYVCQKAITNYKGRIWTAWYTPEIPIQEGPWKLCGLPGLILKAEDNQHTYNFEANGLEQIHHPHNILYKGNKYEPITRKNLNKLYTRYYADPVGFITNDPNIKITITDENGNKTANPKSIPYNPIEK